MVQIFGSQKNLKFVSEIKPLLKSTTSVPKTEKWQMNSEKIPENRQEKLKNECKVCQNSGQKA